MKKVKLFEEFVSEVSKQMISGTSGRTITTLDNRKYELKKDVKDARIGDYINVVLPKGTIISNLPGGVFANHKDLKDKYCTGYKSERWDDKFGVGIRTMPDTLEAIEYNSKVLESIDIEEILNELHLSSAGVKDFLRAIYNSNTNIIQKLNFKNFRGLTDYIKGSDIEEFDELRDEAKAAGLILLESTINEAKKQKFVLYTNPGNSTSAGYIAIGAADVREVLSDAKNYSDSCKILYQGNGTQDDLVKAKNMFSDYRFGDESIDEAVELVHIYDTKGELQGTGELVKTKGNKSLIRWDGSSEEWIDSKLVKLVEGTITPKMANNFKIGNKIKTQKGTYTITGFGSKTGATRDFEAENENGDKFNLRVSLRGATGIQVAAGKSLNFPEQEEMLESTMSLDENFPGPGETVDAKDLDYDMLDYFNRTNKVLSIDTKSKKGIKGSVGKMYNDLVFNGDSIAKKDIVRVKILEGTYNNDREIAIYDGEDGLTYIEKRGKGYYGYNDEFDFEAENKAELEKKLKSWKYKLISGSIDEAFVGPFLFSNSTSDEDLKKMYDDALSGYANWLKGFEYPKADYKKAYQEIEKLLKKRGIKVDESIVNEHSLQESKQLNEGLSKSEINQIEDYLDKYVDEDALFDMCNDFYIDDNEWHDVKNDLDKADLTEWAISCFKTNGFKLKDVKTIFESTVNEAKILSRAEMKNVMVTKYGLNFVKNSEEFDGEEGGIWLGGNDGLLMPNAKDDMFNYYHGGSKYPQGIHKDLAKFLDKCGWYGQFADPGTVFLWPR